MTSAHYYVYILARPNGKPFYVGKGARSRVYAHESEARRGHVCHKCNIIRKIWRKGGQVQRYIIFTTDSEAEALEWETKTIALYDSKTLANKTDGGEGTSGFKHTTQTKRKQSAARKRYLADPENRSKALNHLASVRPTGEQITEINRRLSARPEEIERRRTLAKNQWETTDLRSKVSAAAKARWADPEFRARMSNKAKARMGTPEARSAQMKSIRARRHAE